MKVKYLAHASFLLETRQGVRIITDPYESGGFGGDVRYKPITEQCNIILISHEHADHNYTRSIPGKPTLVRSSANVSGINFKAVASYHDPTRGSQRGKNTIFVFEADGATYCHLGDLGHTLTDEHKSQVVSTTGIGKVDVLFIPVGGVFTIDPREATQVVTTLNPKLIIPMHYKTQSIGFPLAQVSEFTSGKPNVKEIGLSTAEITLPAQQEIWVLTPALL